MRKIFVIHRVTVVMIFSTCVRGYIERWWVARRNGRPIKELCIKANWRTCRGGWRCRGVLYAADDAVLRDAFLDRDSVARFLTSGDSVASGRDGDLDLGVNEALQAGRVSRRHVELMQRRSREQAWSRHVQLAGISIDAKDSGLVAASDTIGDLAGKPGIKVGRYYLQDWTVYGAVATQGHVIFPRLEDWPVVVHVRHFDAHDRYSA